MPLALVLGMGATAALRRELFALGVITLAGGALLFVLGVTAIRRAIATRPSDLSLDFFSVPPSRCTSASENVVTTVISLNAVTRDGSERAKSSASKLSNPISSRNRFGKDSSRKHCPAAKRGAEARGDPFETACPPLPRKCAFFRGRSTSDRAHGTVIQTTMGA